MPKVRPTEAPALAGARVCMRRCPQVQAACCVRLRGEGVRGALGETAGTSAMPPIMPTGAESAAGSAGAVEVGRAAGADCSADTGRMYLCIDLKCFYASVECVARGWDPFTTRLVVADESRGKTTICLAVSPAMKAAGVRNRCRLFEIPPGVDYVAVSPRMQRYMEVSADIYAIYLRYISPDDIHVYSIDECFIDATPYLSLYGVSADGLARMLMGAVRHETGICATAGIGTNLFLAKVALDITAKHAPDNIGYLDEAEFKRSIWTHRPITDIWNIGPGIARRLAKYGVHDLLGVAFMQEDVLYREFGVNAEFLIDHAWGREPCTIAQIHAYEPEGRSICNGQILPCDYGYDDALLVMKEMVDASVLDLVEKHLVCNHISLMVGYARGGSAGSGVTAGTGMGGPGTEGPEVDGSDAGSPNERIPKNAFVGEHGARWVGRTPGGHTGGSRKLSERTNSYRKLLPYFECLFAETTLRDRPIRRINIGFEGLLGEEFATVDLFTDVEADAREHSLQEAVLAVKGKFGKNALVKGMSLNEKATARERNKLIGGHRAGYEDGQVADADVADGATSVCGSLPERRGHRAGF